MMTDQELLEYAAKAAGLERASFVEDSSWGWGITHEHDEYDLWNPLAKDWHAFRLMVDLGIDVEWRADGRVSAYRHANSNGHCFTAFESSREGRAQNTRRAIVRAAAEIGRNMIE